MRWEERKDVEAMRKSSSSPFTSRLITKAVTFTRKRYFCKNEKNIPSTICARRKSDVRRWKQINIIDSTTSPSLSPRPTHPQVSTVLPFNREITALPNFLRTVIIALRARTQKGHLFYRHSDKLERRAFIILASIKRAYKEIICHYGVWTEPADGCKYVLCEHDMRLLGATMINFYGF